MRTHTTLGIAALACAIVVVTNAGPLNPPAGPVAPTLKTLEEVEPRTVLTQTGNNALIIDEPGSYVLGGNVEPFATGIIIQSGRVTLDLNGFEVRGDNIQQFNPEYGVLVDLTDADAIEPVVIRNGTITGFSGASVRSVNEQVRVTVEDVYCEQGEEGGIVIASEGVVRRCNVVFGNASASTAGISLGQGTIEGCLVRAVSGDGYELRSGVVRDSRAEQATGDGFELGGGVLTSVSVQNCTSVGSGANGFAIGGRASLIGCVAEGSGLVGFSLGNAATLESCVANNNGATGFAGVNGTVFKACVARDNGVHGFFSGIGAVFESCVSSSNLRNGFLTNTGEAAAFTACSAYANAEDGFATGEGSTLTGCTATANGQVGFDTGTANMLDACVAQGNGDDGFALGSDSRIMNSLSDGNGRAVPNAAGIRGGSDTTIDSNTVTDNAFGIVTGSGSIVIRNTAAGNSTAYSTVGSDAGPVSTDPLTATNPWSNFSY